MQVMDNKKNGKSVLFVDDDEQILDVVGEFFRLKGNNVFLADNGHSAKKILAQEKIDCCFTDINMPGMDGLALAEHLRKTDNSIPVVIMTGFPSLDNTIKTLKNGVVDFLIKPVNLNQMEICLNRIFRERKLFVENILLNKEVEHKERLEKLNRELSFKVDELNILNSIMQDIAQVTSSSDAFKRAVDLCSAVTHADESRFYVINEGLNVPIEVSVAFSAQTTGGRCGTLAADQGFGRNESNTWSKRSVEKLVMETVSDEIPLLVSGNSGVQGLPMEIVSYMVVPLKIRDKIFGALTASIKQGEYRFAEKDLYYLSFISQNAANAIENHVLYENIYENLFSTLYAFVKAIEAKDPYTQQHSNRVTEIAILIAKEIGCTNEELDILNSAGRLHDIGKIGISDAILLKPGSLTDDEFEKIKEHPDIGAGIVGQLGLWDREKQLIRYHHERFDGCGYPKGLKGEEIPLLARILSLADAYDAMASDRAYRKKMEESKILRIIDDCTGTQFDPQVVAAFRKVFKQGVIARDHILDA